jgi:uncharacterized protein (TIGR03435 family)
MNIARYAVTVCLATCAFALLAQAPAPQKKPAAPASTEPLVVDVHAAPYRPTIDYTVNVGHQRFDMRNVTIVNMIDFAHGIDDDDGREDASIIGGPAWIDFDRFDVSAAVPSLRPSVPNGGQQKYGMFPTNSYDTIRPAVERILAERFNLRYHTGERPLPGYLVTVAKDGPKLAEAKDGTAPGGCAGAQEKDNPGRITVTCTSETIAQFLTLIGGTFRHPLLDRTGLTKPYDFALRFSSEQLATREDSIHSYIEELGKQLGIAVTLGNVPQPAIVVDHVDRVPTPNPPEIAKAVPAHADLEFEVASIRPADKNEPPRRTRPSGSQITFGNFSMQELLTQAFQLSLSSMLGNVPDWLPHERYTIVAKLPPGVDGRTVLEDQDQLDDMLKKLLVSRFHIQYHWGEQTEDGYVLLAGSPKMKKADPNSRTYCKFGPAEGEKDVRRADSAFNGMFHCQNVTMAQLANLAQPMARSEIGNHVVDKTGLPGSYDFSLSFTTGRKLRADMASAQAAAKTAGEATAAPVEGLGIEDAYRKELGVRLEKRPLSQPFLILDRIEQQPTEN